MIYTNQNRLRYCLAQYPTQKRKLRKSELSKVAASPVPYYLLYYKFSKMQGLLYKCS